MQVLMQPVRRSLARGQQWFVRSRAGSVLILVVALLVLMALIGTAFMSMAQADRTTASLHTNNTEIDLLADGVIDLVKGAVTGEVTAGGQFRPAVSLSNFATYGSGEPGTYSNATGVGFGSDVAFPGSGILPASTFLGSRVPELLAEVDPAANGTATAANMPLWRFISAAVIGSQFSSPLPPQTAGPTPFLVGQDPLLFLSPPYSYTQRNLMIPWFMTSSDGTIYPAWTNDPAGPNRMLAADADGDGIADSGYVKLPMGQVNGLTYYIAVRIVDLNSAVNANIAWVNNTITTANNGAGSIPPQLPGDFFPTNIDLQDFINAGDTLNLLTSYRFNGLTPLSTAPYIANNDSYGSPATSPPRVDLVASKFTTAMEAYWMQAGRRMANPANAVTLFRTLPTTDSANLVRNFILRPSGNSVSNYSTLELDLQNSLIPVAAPSQPYRPDNTIGWYNQNFSFMNQASNASNPRVLPLRSLTTLSNPVTSYAPNKFRSIGNWSASPSSVPGNSYQFGDMVTFTDTTVSPNAVGHFVCINQFNANAGTLPGFPNAILGPGQMPPSTPFPGATNSTQYDSDTWVYEPWNDAPTKTSVNTGTFGQLWLAYWSAMADQRRADGLWAPAYPSPANSYPAGDVYAPQSRMFRSPMRFPIPNPPAAFYKTLPTLSPIQVMQLRSALAAVNTIDMRDSDDDITSRTIHLVDFQNTDGSGATTVRNAMTDVVATVYGTERQPFITQVYATNATYNDGTTAVNGYVAVQLHNPDSAPITLTNWQLATVVRPDTYLAGIVPDYRPVLIPMPAGMVITIPANGYVVLSSDATPPAPVNFPPNVTPPAVGPNPPPPPPNQVNLYVIPGLTAALNQELYLFRPHSGAGVFSVVGMPATTANTGANYNPLPVVGSNLPGRYNESAAGAINPLDMIPVDSYDLTGLIVPYAGTQPTEWYYVRPSLGGGATSKAWHFVYPGHYQFHTIASLSLGLDTEAPRYIDGTAVNIIPPSTGLLGQVLLQAQNVIPADRAANRIPIDRGQAGPAMLAYHDVPVELNSPDAGGPNGTRLNTAEFNGFPYGGFARNVDVLQVPYIGAYRLSVLNPATNLWQVLEINTVSSDSLMALGLLQLPWDELLPPSGLLTAGEDPYFPKVSVNPNGADPVFNPTTLAPVENIGRFGPISLTDFDPTLPLATRTFPNDFTPAPAVGAGPPAANTLWLYHWSTRVLDYLTVQCPQQDYLPDVDPGLADGSTTQYKYQKATSAFINQPQPVANSNASIVNAERSNPSGSTEQKAGVQGLVNVNTAPWEVLATVPFLPADYPAYDNTLHAERAVAQNNIAVSIAYYRDVLDPVLNRPHGPFRSLFELNNVPIHRFFVGSTMPDGTYFRDVLSYGASAATPTTFTSIFGPPQGKISPAYPPEIAASNGPVVGDFSAKYLMINRVSNLLTTRSDSFVAYILIEGWQNAEQPNARVAVTRRLAYLIDRSGVTSLNPSPSVTYIPSN